MKANKALLTLLMCLLIGTNAFAQESLSKQINQIKRDNSYLYAEATMNSADDAFNAARELLMQQALEYVSTTHNANQPKDLLVKNVNDHSASLSMQRGNMFRIFVYVKKSDVDGAKDATALDIDDSTSKELVEQSVPSVPTPEKLTKDEEQKAPLVEEAPDENMDELSKETQSDAKMKKPTGKKQPVEEEKEEPTNDVKMPAWQVEVIDDLLKCSDIASANALLSRMKVEYKIKKYGTPNDCPNPEKAYWIIFDINGGVNTVLGPGSTERVNFRNMQKSTLDNYKGLEAIWFNMAK